jgi:hypothetical protein
MISAASKTSSVSNNSNSNSVTRRSSQNSRGIHMVRMRMSAESLLICGTFQKACAAILT